MKSYIQRRAPYLNKAWSVCPIEEMDFSSIDEARIACQAIANTFDVMVRLKYKDKENGIYFSPKKQLV
jgi:hypothetical protein